MEQILPANNVVVKDGELEIKDIRIEESRRDRQEVYTIILTEKTAPKIHVIRQTNKTKDNNKYNRRK